MVDYEPVSNEEQVEATEDISEATQSSQVFEKDVDTYLEKKSRNLTEDIQQYEYKIHNTTNSEEEQELVMEKNTLDDELQGMRKKQHYVSSRFNGFANFG